MIEPMAKFTSVTLPLSGREPVDITCQLLHAANQDPPGWLRAEFYECKTQILRTWGTRVCPNHIQRIASVCWHCNGRGVYWAQSSSPRGCIRCGGSGFYRCRHVVLERWRLRASDTPDCYREFHVPTDVVANQGTRVDIEGKIVKYRQGDTEESAMRLLWSWKPSQFIELCLRLGYLCEADSALGDFARHLGYSRARVEREKANSRPSADVPF